MRQQRTPMNGDGAQVGYTFSFQIADDGRRRACRVKVDAPNIHDASALFRERWPDIEEMARNCIRAADGDDVIILDLH
jgi:hypothetical protein